LFGVIGAMGFTYIAFEGYEIIVQSGEEVVDPGTNIPKAVFYSMVIVVPVYILVAFAAIGGIDVTQHLAETAGMAGQQQVATWELLGNLGELGIIEAAGQFMPYGAPLLLFAGLAATMSALNATIYSSSRVSFAMGRDRVLPAFFNSIHSERRTPHWAIFFSGILIVVMAIALPIESVAAAADIMFIFLFLQVNWTVIRMRQTHPDLPRTYTIPYMPWPPLIGIGLQFILLPFLIFELGLEAIGIGTGNEGLVALTVSAIWMLGGLALYYGYSVGKEAEQLEKETPTVVTEETPSAREQRLVVPIANPESVEQLMRTAIDIAQDRNADIRVMSVVTVPQETPPNEGRQFIDEERDVLNDAIDFAAEQEPDVPVSGTVRIGHDITQAILNTAEQDDADLLLMGWRGQQRRSRDLVLGSNVDEVVTRAPCDVLVERISPVEDVESILLPTAGGPHSEFAAEVAGAIARTNDARVDAVRVIEPNPTDEERADAQERLDATFGAIETEDIGIEHRLVVSEEIAEAIISESAEYDLTIIGATREGVLQQFVFGGIPEEVGRRAENTVIMAKRNLGISSRVNRLLGRNGR
jgi:nucleotide-binding universal stress UspA family protein/uncharacterized membrane protein